MPLKPRTKAALIGDFLSEAAAVEETIAGFAGHGAEGQAVMIADPIEETFPFDGHTEFLAAAGPEPAPRAARPEPARSLSRAARRPSRGGARGLAARGWGFALHRHASAAQALLALRARLPVRAGARRLERLDVWPAARFCRAGGARRAGAVAALFSSSR